MTSFARLAKPLEVGRKDWRVEEAREHHLSTERIDLHHLLELVSQHVPCRCQLGASLRCMCASLPLINDSRPFLIAGATACVLTGAQWDLDAMLCRNGSRFLADSFCLCPLLHTLHAHTPCSHPPNSTLSHSMLPLRALEAPTKKILLNCTTGRRSHGAWDNKSAG